MENMNWWCGTCGSRGAGAACGSCGVLRPTGNPAGMLALLNQGTAMVQHNVTHLTVEGDVGLHFTESLSEDRAMVRAGTYIMPLEETSYMRDMDDEPVIYPPPEFSRGGGRREPIGFIGVTILAATWVGIIAVAFGVLFFSAAVIGACMSAKH